MLDHVPRPSRPPLGVPRPLFAQPSQFNVLPLLQTCLACSPLAPSPSFTRAEPPVPQTCAWPTPHIRQPLHAPQAAFQCTPSRCMPSPCPLTCCGRIPATFDEPQPLSMCQQPIFNVSHPFPKQQTCPIHIRDRPLRSGPFLYSSGTLMHEGMHLLKNGGIWSGNSRYQE